MQRDMDLIRAILTEVRSRTDLEPRPVRLEGFEKVVVDRHVEMLIEEGYLEGKCASAGNSPDCVVSDLSMKGHDLVAAIANDAVWASLKTTWSSDEFSGVPFIAVKTVSSELLLHYLKHKAGL